MAGERKGRRTRTGVQYFNEFRTHFWERPEDDFDRLRDINSSNRRRHGSRRSHTPAPSIEERLSSRRSSFTQRALSRSLSPIHNPSSIRIDNPSSNNETSNSNIGNNDIPITDNTTSERQPTTDEGS